MFRFGQKLQIFIFGLTVGLLIGCLIFIFKLDDYFAKFSFSDSKNKGTVIEEVVKPEPEQVISKENNKQTNKTAKAKTSNPQDSLASNSGSSINNTFLEEAEENINVLKEELIGVKNIVVKDFDNSKLYKNSSDSLISVMSGINEGKRNDFFMIEFWKTPLNSKGYKMSRNRLLIYGLPEKEDVSIVKMDDNYYFKNNATIYKINYSNEFKPMEKITEGPILEKFNL